MINNIEKIHSFAERLLLGENSKLTKESYVEELDYALNHAHNILNSKDEYHEHNKFELRLRLAIHFSPLDAINFEPSSDFKREELVSFHLQKHFNKNKENANKLAEAIVNILYIWENKRVGVGIYRKKLLAKQGYKCSHCKVKFILDGRVYKVDTIFKNDNYKPYTYPRKKITDGYIEYLTTEVDHIKPISALGDNNLDNLQVLCKLCNQAKSNILSVKTLNEIKYAAYDIEELIKEKPTHIHKMLYFTIHKANRECELCEIKNDEDELTIRKIIKTGSFTRSNLQALCLKCSTKIDKI